MIKQTLSKEQLRAMRLKRADAWSSSAFRMQTAQCKCVALQYAQLWYHDAGMPQHAKACGIAFAALIEVHP